ncbi:hypothetical protein [Draconibacterium sp.]|uniref:hypothetical protein n=1 Tax=Draconibacterium sp. TaxID=1965318 RepID=UPI00356A7798
MKSLNHSILLLFLMVTTPVTVQAQNYNFKILTDINQIWRNELPSAERIKSDGVWSLPGNSGAIPLTEWKAGFNKMGPGVVFTEEYFERFPKKAFTPTKEIIGQDNIEMVCIYAEPKVVANDPHPTTIVFDEIIDSVAHASGKKVIVLSRSYSIPNWKNELLRALNNENVGGVCFEAHVTHTKEIVDFKIIVGLQLALDRNKLAFLLLPPDGGADNNYRYEDHMETTFKYLDKESNLLRHSDFHIVVAAYNRLREDKNTTMLGERNSVEASVKRLIYLRDNQ